MMHQYGPVFRISMPPNMEAVVICDPDLAGQVIENSEVWPKTHFKHNKMVRAWVNQGLFTADDDEEIWGVAHRILLPAFSNQGMKQYFNVVQECIAQLFVKWDGMAVGNQPVDLTKSTELFTFDVSRRGRGRGRGESTDEAVVG
jgi:cytochrome P450/NADPH-cytochrome P450 reductase